MLHRSILSVALVAIFVFSNEAWAATPKGTQHERINRFLRDAWNSKNIQTAPVASDRQWVRRVYLDLVGRIPSSEETQTFLADSREGKRAHLVDVLLSSEDYVQHFADVFDVLLMGRTDERNYGERVKHQWRSYLESAFRDNRPWDDVVGEILLGRPTSERDKGAAWFLFERKNDHQKLAEAVAPGIFGLHIECAQCHDHMSVDEIKQEHYWGLVAFFNRSKNKHTKNGPRIAESAIGGFSEFADIHGSSSPNVLSFLGAPKVDEPRPGKDVKQEDEDVLYVPALIKNDPKVPRFSRRQKLVEVVARGNPLIARALVNRVWAMLLGRGLVHPFDKMDSMHPPSHPKLLDWLTTGFEYSGFDIQRLVRTIVLCDAYQLSSIQPNGVNDPSTFAWYLERPLTAEQMARSIQLALRGRYRNDHDLVKNLRQKFTEVLPEQFLVTVKDTLYWSNNKHLAEFIRASAGKEQLVGEMKDCKTHDERARLAFNRLYGREPESEEAEAIAAYLSDRHLETTRAIEQVLWALITSAEFRLNH